MDGGEKEKDSILSKRDALNFLIVDETEAIKGYDDMLSKFDWSDEDRVKLEQIRNAEIDHIEDLSKLLRKNSNINIVGTDSVRVSDGVKDVKWEMHQAKSGYFYFKAPDGRIYSENGVEVRFGNKVSAGEFYIKNLFNKELWNGVPKVIVDSVVAVDGGYSICFGDNAWLMYNKDLGTCNFGSAKYRTVFSTDSEATEVYNKILN